MTSFYGVNNTKAYQNVPAEKIPAGEQNGRLRVAYDKISLTEAVAGNVLHMMKIPAGARVIDAIIKVADLDSNTDGTLDVGWAASSDAVEAADADGFFNELNVQSARSESISGGNASVPGHMKKFSSEVEVQIVPGAGVADATSGDIELVILYVID